MCLYGTIWRIKIPYMKKKVLKPHEFYEIAFVVYAVMKIYFYKLIFKNAPIKLPFCRAVKLFQLCLCV